MKGYTQDIRVDFHDLDFNGICRAASLLKYMQTNAQHQLNANKMSYDELQAMNKAFILSRIRLEFYEPVYAEQMLKANTYPCTSSGFSFLRSFELSLGEQSVARAISIWALVDTKEKSLTKVSDFTLGIQTYDAPADFGIPRIKFPSDLSAAGTYKVAYGDLDRNKHMNNTRYPDIYACFLPLSGKRISSMTISYMNEAKFAEVLTVFLGERDGAYYIRTVKEDGRVNSEAEITICDI